MDRVTSRIVVAMADTHYLVASILCLGHMYIFENRGVYDPRCLGTAGTTLITDQLHIPTDAAAAVGGV
jgi:hypothetical protein